MSVTIGFLAPGILFILTVGFGYWVSRKGKPYNGLLFNIHKLIALGAVVLTAVRIFQMYPLSKFPTNAVFLIAVVVVCVIAMFTTGAVMSIREEKSRLLLVIHQIAPILITLSIGWTIYLL